MRAALPADVSWTVVYDRSELVNRTLRTVGKSLVEGGALVALVLFAMLGSLRAGLIVAAVIPLSMLCAAAAMARRDDGRALGDSGSREGLQAPARVDGGVAGRTGWRRGGPVRAIERC